MRQTARQLATWSLTLALLASSACDREAESPSSDSESSQSRSLVDIPSDQSWSGWTKREQYFVEVAPQPNPIPFQQLFELKVRVWQSEGREEPVAEAELDDVRARMPAHDHGMKTAPEIEAGEAGEFLVRGMRFHMQGLEEDGKWVIETVVDGPDGVDRAKFAVQCCRPGSQ